MNVLGGAAMISRREQLVVGQARNTLDNGVEVRVS